MQVCDATEEVLLHLVLKLGNAQEFTDGFACMWFPNCIGATDRTHVPIIPPPPPQNL